MLPPEAARVRFGGGGGGRGVAQDSATGQAEAAATGGGTSGSPTPAVGHITKADRPNRAPRVGLSLLHQRSFRHLDTTSPSGTTTHAPAATSRIVKIAIAVAQSQEFVGAGKAAMHLQLLLAVLGPNGESSS